jgi:asparagine synthase (glutamine-hydrolysing)
VDEWKYALRVAERFEAKAHRVEPTVEGFLEELPLLVLRQGGPFDSPSVYSQWCVMRAAADEGVVVLLDGQGADETWGGYSKYVWFAFVEALLAFELGSGGPSPDAMQVLALALPERARHAARIALRHAWTWIGSALRDGALVDPQGDKLRGPLLRQAAVTDARRVILPRLLRYADRNSMAWSRELRLPFLDERVVASGFASGWRQGLERGWTKEPLRRLAERRLPPEIAWRRAKIAYDIPDREWLAHPRILDRVDSALSLLRELRIVSQTKRVPLSPWRTISLASFLEENKLFS